MLQICLNGIKKLRTQPPSSLVFTLIIFVVLLFTFIGYQLAIKTNNLVFIQKTLQNEYYYGFDEKKAISAIMNSLNDPYSYFIDNETTARLDAEDKGEYSGIGVLYSISDKGIKILEALPNSPANEAGLKSGDIIISIDGITSTTFTDTLEVGSILRKGTGDLHLEISSLPQNKKLIIKKENFNSPSLIYKTLEKDVGYLKIYKFRSTTIEEFEDIKNDLKKASKLVIDLRNNTGGLTETALALENEFISAGTLLIEKWKDGKETKTNAINIAQFREQKIIILVNQETSSAAESFATAFLDNNRATLLGEKTYGKGTTGTTLPVNKIGAIHFTVNEWFRPNGSTINETGITPSVIIQNDLSTPEDEQLSKAQELILE